MPGHVDYRNGLVEGRGLIGTRYQQPGHRPEAPVECRWENHVRMLQRTHWHGAIRMWATVLLDATKCLGMPAVSRWHQEALEWVRDNSYDDSVYPFPFNNVCAELEIDADWVRRDLLERASQPARLEAVA